MLDLFKRNFKCGLLLLLIEPRENPNKYNMNQLYITGIDIEIGNVLTFGIGLLSERNAYQVNWVLNKFFTEIQTLSKGPYIKTVVCDLDKIMIKVIPEVFEGAQVIISHGSVLRHFRSICASNGVPEQVFLKAQECLQDALTSDSKTAT